MKFRSLHRQDAARSAFKVPSASLAGSVQPMFYKLIFSDLFD